MEKKEDLRNVHKINQDGSEQRIEWADIKAGDKIKITEYTGEAVTYRGWDTFVATEDSRLMEDPQVYGVAIIPYVHELDETHNGM